MGRSLTFARFITHQRANASKGIQYDNIPGINSGPVSIALWAKRVDTQAGDQHLLFVDQTAGDADDGGVQIISQADGSARFQVKYSVTDAQVIRTNMWPVGEWRHVVCTYDGVTGSRPIFYRNGEESNSGDVPSSGTRLPAPGSHSIGGRESTSNRGWGGLLAGVGRWQRVLTAAEAAQLAQGMHPTEMHPHDLVICPDFGTLENLADRRTTILPNLIEHDGSVYAGPPQLRYPKPRFALAPVSEDVRFAVVGKKPSTLVDGLLRAFFFDRKTGLIHDAVQTGQTVTLDAGVTPLSPFGVDIPRTDDVEVTVDRDREMPFEFQPRGLDNPTSMFFHFRFDGSASDANEFTLSNNTTALGLSIFNASFADSTVEDGLEHTLLVTTSRKTGMHVYFDGVFVSSDLIEDENNLMNNHLVRYDSQNDTWDIIVGSNSVVESEQDIMIGGTAQKSADRWDGPIYGALYWHRKLTAVDARWLHSHYRKLQDDLSSKFALVPFNEDLPDLATFEKSVTSMPLRSP